MLVQFKLKNFATFRGESEIKFLASNYDQETLEDENIFQDKNFGHRVLKSAAIFGANASGKSRFLEGLLFMRHFAIHSSTDSQFGDHIPVEPFLLNTESEHEPSEFEVVFLSGGIQYRYGFEASKDEIVSEWMYRKEKRKEIEIFYRDHQEFEIHPREFKKGNFAVKEKMVRPNVLLLSLTAQLNEETSIEVIEWFRNLKGLSGNTEDGYRGFTVAVTKEPGKKEKILKLLKAADMGIQDIDLDTINSESLPSGMTREERDRLLKRAGEEGITLVSDVLTFHKKYNGLGKEVGVVPFSLEEDESSGTQKFFALTGPVLDVLDNGSVLVVDELDSKLHPNLVCKIISLFHSKETNPNNAQLIFNSHNTNLLGSGLFRRDQIWFTEKNEKGEGEIYSLASFKSSKVRKNEAYEQNYVRGKYGGVPYLDSFETILIE